MGKLREEAKLKIEQKEFSKMADNRISPDGWYRYEAKSEAEALSFHGVDPSLVVVEVDEMPGRYNRTVYRIRSKDDLAKAA